MINGKSMSLVMSKSSGITFLSCHVEYNLNFWIYIKPFRTKLWIVIVITILVMWAATSAVAWVKHKTLHFYVFLVIGNIFGQGFVSSACEKTISFRLLSGPWILVLTILTDCYLAILIETMSVAKPLPKVYSLFEAACVPDGILELDFG